jgi:hypothetical protein
MQLKHIVLSLLFISMYSGCYVPEAKAQAADALKDIEPSVVAEMVDLYSSICLKTFPDDAGIDTLATSKNASPLTADQLKLYLHDDPGRGWYLRTPNALYAITIEHPPVRTCAIRRMTPSGINTIKSYIQAEQAYAMSKGAKLAQVPIQNSKSAAGADIMAIPHVLLGADGKPTEGLFVFLTTYHGRVPNYLGCPRKGAATGQCQIKSSLPRRSTLRNRIAKCVCSQMYVPGDYRMLAGAISWAG